MQKECVNRWKFVSKEIRMPEMMKRWVNTTHIFSPFKTI